MKKSISLLTLALLGVQAGAPLATVSADTFSAPTTEPSSTSSGHENSLSSSIKLPEGTNRSHSQVDTVNNPNLANFYVNIPKTGAYGGVGVLKLRPFSYEGTSSGINLYDLYIVIPKGLSIDGGVAALKEAYNQYLSRNSMISSNPSIDSLGTTSDGREVYRIITNGTTTASSDDFIDVPISITNDTSITDIHSNSGNQASNNDYNVIYAGDNTGITISVDGSYPKKNSSDTILAQVGVNNVQVSGIENDDYVRTMTLFKAKTVDIYVLKEKNTGEILQKKEFQGTSGDTYSRVGFIDTINCWDKIDSSQYDLNTYTIQEGESLSGSATLTPKGTLGGDPNVTYSGNTYELYINKFGADVTIKYQDTDGNEIADDVVKSGNIGESYDSEQLKIEGYTFKEVKGDPTGTFSDKAQTVTYIYTKDPVKGADVTIKYHDTAGNEIADDVVKSGNIGESYDSEQLKIKGYTFKEVKGDPTGTFSDKAQTVTYIYTKDPVKGADVTIKYHDTAGNEIADDVVKSGNIGESYDSEQLKIEGYTFKEVKGDPTGTFSDKAQTVTYIYSKDSTTPSKPAKTKIIYRVYNPNTGEHFYPTSVYERDRVVKAGWRNEGILETAPTSGTPIYRIYNPNAKGGDHYYTASKYEASKRVSEGWRWDYNGKPVFYSGGTKPVYVAYNPNAITGAHNYTMHIYEQNSLLSIGWKYGAVSWYAVK